MKTNSVLKRLGANIRKAREAASLTQEGLAELSGIHWKTVGYIEGGKRNCAATTLVKIVLLLKIPFDRILEGIELEDDPNRKVISKATARKRNLSKKAKS